MPFCRTPPLPQRLIYAVVAFAVVDFSRSGVRRTEAATTIRSALTNVTTTAATTTTAKATTTGTAAATTCAETNGLSSGLGIDRTKKD